MIKKILLAICVAFPMLAVAQAPKFGVVNTQEVLDAMPDVKKVQEQIAAASKKNTKTNLANYVSRWIVNMPNSRNWTPALPNPSNSAASRKYRLCIRKWNNSK